MPDAKPHYDAVYLVYHDEITTDKSKALMEVCSQIVMQLEVDDLHFLFSSSGGAVDSAITLYNFIKALPMNIVMHNIGSIDSAANVVFMAGAERYAAQDTSFLFHGVGYGFGVIAGISKSQIEEGLSIITEAENKIANILASNSSLTENEVRKLFERGESKPASFALSKGVVTELRQPAIPNGAPIYTVNTSSNT
jgi:ATP-dependent protease ClpP protease subunit